jgi:glutamate-1-semialdehyde 2,1-aminomutase
MAAADAVLDVIAGGALEKVDAHGKKLMAGWKKTLEKAGVPHVIQGPPSMPGIVFTDKDICVEYRDWAESDHDLYETVIQKLIAGGVMPDHDSREPWFISASHTDEDAEFSLIVFEEAVKEVCG